jgi:hypothetical protein
MGENGEIGLKFSGISEDPRLEIREERLYYYELKSILKLIVVKDVLPHDCPVKTIRNFY